MTRILALVFIAVVSCQVPLPYQLEGHKVIFQNDGQTVSISAISDNVVRVQYEGETYYSNRLYGPVKSNPQPFDISNKDNEVVLRTAQLEVKVTLTPFDISFNDNTTGLKLSEEDGFFQRGDTLGFRFSLSENEAIYGTGSRAIPMNRRGERFMNYNQPQYGYDYGSTEINYSIPHIYSSNEYMLLIDNPAKAWFDIGHTEQDVLEFASLGGNMSYYFINGEGFSSLINEYTDLTGKQPLPPIWTLGNLHSRFGYHSQTETEASVKKALDQDYPIDAVILDIYWFGPELEDGQMGRLDWDTVNWPDPKRMVQGFRKQDIKTIIVSEPFFTLKSGEFDGLAEQGLLATTDDGEAATIPEFYFGEAGLLDIFQDGAKKWIWDRYKYIKSYGVEGWWVDLGEPEKHPSYMIHENGTADEIHGVYGHEWAKTLYEGYKDDYPGERLMHLGRSGFAGSQRYGLIPWSGDISRSWSGFKAQLPIMLGMGISGLGYMHSDAGGFSMVEEPDEELYTRWIQFAAFTPIFRPHADQVVPAEPSEWPPEVQQNVKPYVELRYKLLPYNYTLAWQNMTTGMPLARPMFVEFSNLPDTLESQYMWGESFLVAPVLSAGLEAQEVYLPEGKWYNYWNNNPINGSQWYTQTLSMAETPVYVKAGSIIPSKSAINRTTQYFNGQLTLSYYYNIQSSQTSIYFDDGSTPQAYYKGDYQLIEIEANPTENGITFSFNFTGEAYIGAPESRKVTIEVIGYKNPLVSNDIDVTVTSIADRQVIAFELPSTSKELVLRGTN